MKKIVILGCENSHADTFLAFIRDKEEFKNIELEIDALYEEAKGELRPEAKALLKGGE